MSRPPPAPPSPRRTFGPSIALLPPPGSLSDRVRALQAEARSLARQHTTELVKAMRDVEALALEVANGGDVYSPGVVNEARLLAEALAERRLTLQGIIARNLA